MLYTPSCLYANFLYILYIYFCVKILQPLYKPVVIIDQNQLWNKKEK